MDKDIEELKDLVSDMCLPTPDHIAAIKKAIKIMESYKALEASLAESPALPVYLTT